MWTQRLRLLVCVLLGLGLALFWHSAQEERQTLLVHGGNYSDLYPRWLGVRELLTKGRDPYSAAVTADIQFGFYGRVLAPNDPIRDIQAFAYPLTVVPLLAPFVFIPFSVAGPLITGVMVAALVAGLWSWIGALLPAPRFRRAGLVVAALLSIPFVEALLYQQLSLLFVALVALTGGLLLRGRLLGVGLTLAVLSFKPHLALIPTAGLVLWAASSPHRHRSLLLGFGAGACALLGFAEVLMPGWVWYFVPGLHAYAGYVQRVTPVQGLLGTGALAMLAAAGIVGYSLLLWWRARGQNPRGPAVKCAFVTSVLATTMVIPTPAFYDKALVFLPLFVLLAQSRETDSSGLRAPRLTLTLHLVVLAYAAQALTGVFVHMPLAVATTVLLSFSLVAWQYVLPFMALVALVPWPSGLPSAVQARLQRARRAAPGWVRQAG